MCKSHRPATLQFQNIPNKHWRTGLKFHLGVLELLKRVGKECNAMKELRRVSQAQMMGSRKILHSKIIRHDRIIFISLNLNFLLNCPKVWKSFCRAKVSRACNFIVRSQLSAATFYFRQTQLICFQASCLFCDLKLQRPFNNKVHLFCVFLPFFQVEDIKLFLMSNSTHVTYPKT